MKKQIVELVGWQLRMRRRFGTRAVEDGGGLVVKIVASTARLAWSVTTYFSYQT
jgi:hypothetical protein